MLSDGQWDHRLSAHIIEDERTCGSSGRDIRMFAEAVLWIVRAGSRCGISQKRSANGAVSFGALADGAAKACGSASSR